eukprot:12881398-Prorocentrum_lima.AAC.1
MAFYLQQVTDMIDRSQRAAQELGGEPRTNSGTPRSQDIPSEVDSGSGTGSGPATQAERKKAVDPEVA